MFSDALKFKAILLGVAGYLLLSTIIFAVVVQFWIPSGITDPNEMARLAEADPSLLRWQAVLGVLLGILAGFSACYFSGCKGLRNSLVVGALFLLYGIVAIYLHPSHPLMMQVGKVVSPIPLTLLGGWLCLWIASVRTSSRTGA